MQKTFDSCETVILNSTAATCFLVNEQTTDFMLFPLSAEISDALLAEIRARALVVAGVIGIAKDFGGVYLSLEIPITAEMSKKVSAAFAAAVGRSLDALERMFLLPDLREMN